ncbi:MAG: hypothetical protein LWX08_08030 [Deltaproteobacteria bacterium]|jgi:hypothetical protein|nr:hypothetical protein [Deltaproteobacteria bacterium]
MRPLIFDFCEHRIGEENPPYFYDESQDVNVIKLKTGRIIPFIDCDAPVPEIETKTDVSREQEDECITMAELITKTATKREQDDSSPRIFLELVTKTKVQRERDDE